MGKKGALFVVFAIVLFVTVSQIGVLNVKKRERKVWENSKREKQSEETAL